MTRHDDNAVPVTSREQVADRLHSAAIHLLRRVHQEDEASGVGPARLSALSVLVFAGPMSLGQLAAAERVKPPTMSRVVAGLKRGGLAEVVTDAADTRRVQIRATAKGTRLLQKARQRRIAALAESLAGLGPQDLALLSKVAELIEDALRRSQT